MQTCTNLHGIAAIWSKTKGSAAIEQTCMVATPGVAARKGRAALRGRIDLACEPPRSRQSSLRWWWVYIIAAIAVILLTEGDVIFVVIGLLASGAQDGGDHSCNSSTTTTGGADPDREPAAEGSTTGL